MKDLPPSLRPNETTHLRPFGGSAERKTVLDVHAGGRLRGQVKVDRLELRQRRFAVTAFWHGPPLPLPGQPRSEQTVDAVDELIVDDHDTAVSLAHAAAHELRTGSPPDLRALRGALARAR